MHTLLLYCFILWECIGSILIYVSWMDIYLCWGFYQHITGVFHLGRELRSAWTEEERDSGMGGAFVVYVFSNASGKSWARNKAES